VEGHFFPNPVDPKSYMAMLCYKNGSLSREAVMVTSAHPRWQASSLCVRRWQSAAAMATGHASIRLSRSVDALSDRPFPAFPT
jgi:hypothetical protein